RRRGRVVDLHDGHVVVGRLADDLAPELAAVGQYDAEVGRLLHAAPGREDVAPLVDQKTGDRPGRGSRPDQLGDAGHAGEQVDDGRRDLLADVGDGARL